MKQKEDLTLFGVLLLRVLPTLVVLGALCACVYFLVLPSLTGLVTTPLGIGQQPGPVAVATQRPATASRPQPGAP
ncbi:MAG: hypothetical protein ACM3JD_06650, partial [Rudaea sp.]